jgi:hypothetical protein
MSSSPLRFRLNHVFFAGLMPLFMACAAAAAEAVVPSLIDFENFPVGELTDGSGLRVDKGRAVITGDYAHSGKNSLSLAAGAAEATVRLPWNPESAKTAVVRFWVNGLPAADRAESREFANASGAMVALVKDGSGQGRIWILDASGDSPAWRKTEALLPLSADGATQGWVSLEFRIDYVKGRWSLSVDDVAAASGAGLLVNEKPGRRTFLYGFAEKSWSVDDCTLQVDVDLSADAGVAGGSGRAGDASRGDGVVGDNSGRPGQSGKSSGGDGATSAKVGTLKVVHVSAASGNDANDGSKARPKATLRAAFAALSQAGGDIVVSDGEYRLPFRKFPGVRLVMNGRVEFK